MKFVSILISVGMLLASSEALHIKAAAASYEQGKSALKSREYQVAANSFQKAVGVEPTFIEARKALVGTYLDSGQQLLAATAKTELLEIEPAELIDGVTLGEILLEEKQPEGALAQFSLVLKPDSFNLEALLGFASAAKALGMRDRGQDVLELGHKQYPADARFQPTPTDEQQK